MPDRLTLTVTGMTCGGCENAVKRALARLDGVSAVEASHADDRVIVTYDPSTLTRDAIAEQIERAGYTVA